MNNTFKVNDTLKQLSKLILISNATFGLLVSPALGPASLLDKILKSGEVRIGTTRDYYPFTTLDTKTGKFSGYSTDITNRRNQQT